MTQTGEKVAVEDNDIDDDDNRYTGTASNGNLDTAVVLLREKHHSPNITKEKCFKVDVGLRISSIAVTWWGSSFAETRSQNS